MEEAEIKYIHVKDHQDEIQVFTSFEKVHTHTHTQPGGLGVQGSFL